MVSDGFYNRLALLFMVASYVMLLAAAWVFYRGQQSVDQPNSSVLLGILLLSCGLWLVVPVIGFDRSPLYENLTVSAGSIAMVGVLLGYLLRSRWPRFGKAVFLLVALIPLVVWFLIPRVLPVQGVDVYFFHQRAAALVGEGVNPYSVIIGTPYNFIKPIGYTYPPANLYPLAIAYYLTGDVRWGQAVLMAATAVLLWLVARRTVGGVESELIPLIFLYHPRGILVLDYSFNETIIIFPFALFIYLFIYRWSPAATAFVYGIFVSLKPYLAFLFLPWLIIERRPRNFLFALCGILVPLIPFISSDFKGTIYGGFLFVLQNVPFRADSLSVSSLLFELCGKCSVSWAGLSLPVGVLAAVCTFLFFRNRPSLTSHLYASTIVMFSVFLLGSLAFVGYYYLVSVMILFLIPVVLQQRDGVTEREAKS